MPRFFTILKALAPMVLPWALLVGNAYPAVVTKWSFEDDLLDTAVAGSTADHLAGAALNGPLNTVFVPGIIGQAVQVGRATGDATVLSALDSADLDLAPSFTIEAFVYRTVEHGNDWERFATKWFDGSQEWHWAFRGPPKRSQDLFMNGSQQINQGAVSADIDLGQWYHVAVSGDPTNGLRIWQDGVVVGSGPYLAPINGTDRFRIGNASVGAGLLQFSGWVDEFQIHDLSQDGAYMAGRTALILGEPAITHFEASPGALAAGGSSTLSWTVINPAVLTLDGGAFSSADVTGQASAIASNLTESTIFTLTASNALGQASAQVSVGVGAPGAGVIINEFLAINNGGLQDEDGDDSDWIEIFNPGATPASLAGWFLTDDPGNLAKWTFPAVSLPILEYLVVFASNKDRSLVGSELHTNFKLDGDGEYLALVMPDGITIAHAFTPLFPPQQGNVSYGLSGNPPTEGALFPPTPGAANSSLAGPIIRDLTENPAPVPGDDDAIVISAEILASPSPVTSATLHYRVMFGNEVTLPMSPAGADLFSAAIAASSSSPGEMVRWYVSAESQDGQNSRAPLFLDPSKTPEYFGTVIADPTITTPLPVMQRFVENPAATETASGTRGAFFFNGEFFDNIFTRIRGGTSSNWPKKSYKIDFNDGHHFRFHEGVPRVDEINLNTTYTDKSYLRSVLAYEHQRDAGMPSPEAFLVHFRQNGAFWNLAILVEQPDRDFLRRWDFDPNGAFYKGAISPTRYEPSTPLSKWEKKTRLHEDKSDLDAFIDGIAQTGNALERYLFDHVNLPRQINYMATTCILQNIDGSDKNHYLYRDTEGTGEWTMLPWDLDLTLGPNALNTDTIVASHAFASHPYIGARPYTLAGGKYNHFLEVIVAHPGTRAMLNRRIRSLVDDYLANGYFEARLDELATLIGPDVLLDKAAWGGNAHFGGTDFTLETAIDRIKNEYLVPRVPYLTVTEGPGGAGIPSSQPPASNLLFGTIDFNPVSGNQAEEYIELVNSNTFAVDVSRWRLSGGVELDLMPGTVIPAGSRLYLSPDVPAFRARNISPTGDEGHFVQGDYSGHLSNLGETLTLSDAGGTLVQEITTPVAPSDAQRYLVVSEIMYHPAGNTLAEFVELQNTSVGVTLNLAGLQFTGGVTFDFTGGAITQLAPGARVLVVRDATVFESTHGPGLPVAGAFANPTSLDNGGEGLKIEDASSSTIKEFTYDNNLLWPTAPGGTGPSLVLVNPGANPDPSLPGNWRSSTVSGGNPGTHDATTFTGNPGDDVDANGLDDLLDYALGHAPGVRDGLPVIARSGAFVTLSWMENLAADDATVTPQWSVDLVNWDAPGEAFVLAGLTPDGLGRRERVYTIHPPSLSPGDRLYFRLSVSR
jgi:hypothetical protein